MRRLAVLVLCLVASCAFAKGLYSVGEHAAPAAIGAGTGALVGGPVGAVVGAATGSAVGQAARGNQRTDAQAEAIEDAIRGGSISITPGMVFAEFFWWIVAIGAALLLFPGAPEWLRGIKRLLLKRERKKKPAQDPGRET
jgi:osmotically inducible lipoprotein OsmB